MSLKSRRQASRLVNNIRWNDRSKNRARIKTLTALIDANRDADVILENSTYNAESAVIDFLADDALTRFKPVETYRDVIESMMDQGVICVHGTNVTTDIEEDIDLVADRFYPATDMVAWNAAIARHLLIFGDPLLVSGPVQEELEKDATLRWEEDDNNSELEAVGLGAALIAHYALDVLDDFTADDADRLVKACEDILDHGDLWYVDSRLRGIGGLTFFVEEAGSNSQANAGIKFLVDDLVKSASALNEQPFPYHGRQHTVDLDEHVTGDEVVRMMKYIRASASLPRDVSLVLVNVQGLLDDDGTPTDTDDVETTVLTFEERP